jgi:hypothetical protein
MVTASWLMWAGAALAVVSTVVFFTTIDLYTEALAQATGRTPDHLVVERAVSRQQGQEMFRTIVAVCLWIWMAVKNLQGRKWARVTATVFGVIHVGGFLLGGALLGGIGADEVVEHLIPQLVVGGASVILAIVILVMLFRPDANQFYEESTRYKAALTLRGY